MGFLSDFFGGSSKVEGSSMASPYWAAAPGVNYLMQNLPYATPLEYFPGQTYAPMTADEEAALAQLRAAAGALPGAYEGFLAPAGEAYGAALTEPQSVLGMGLQDVAANPYLASAAEAIQSRVNRNLQENILPGLTRAGVGGGGLGGTRQGVAEGIAARGTTESIADALASLYGQAWSEGLGAETTRYGAAQAARQGAMGLLPTMTGQAVAAETAPAELLMRTGGIERAEQQRAIDEEMARHQFEQMEPWQRSQMSLDLLLPTATAFGTTTTSETARTTPSIMSAAGQLMTLGGMAAPMFGGASPFGGLGGPGYSQYGPWMFSGGRGGYGPYGGWGMGWPNYPGGGWA